MSQSKNGSTDISQPQIHPKYREIQQFGTLNDVRIGLEVTARKKSVDALNVILADTICLRDLYKKHHWQMSGATFYPLHLLLDKHYEQQAALVDDIAERIQSLGGLSIAVAQDVAELTQLPRPPKGREDVPTQIARLLECHEIMLIAIRKAAKAAADYGDDGTNDLLVSQLVRTHELQVWFLAEHLVDAPLIRPNAESHQASTSVPNR